MYQQVKEEEKSNRRRLHPLVADLKQLPKKMNKNSRNKEKKKDE